MTNKYLIIRYILSAAIIITICFLLGKDGINALLQSFMASPFAP